MIIELNREEEFRKQNKRFSEAFALFDLFIKKYGKRKNFKKVRPLGNNVERYIGETIFVDMLNSYSYTKSEKELLFQSLISMPSKALFNFEQLYIKSSKSKLNAYTEALINHNADSKELIITNDIAYHLYNRNKFLEDKTGYLTEKVFNRKSGKYNDIYREYVDCLKQSDNTTRGFKKQLLYTLIDKYYKREDFSSLPDKEYDKFKLLEYKKIKSAIANRIRRSP